MSAVSGTVWLVEDSQLEARLAHRTLAQVHQVELFGEVEPMLERLHTSAPPDVLVLDWHLPGMSGLEACAFLRASLDEVELPILILTGGGTHQAGSVLEGLSAGANDYLRKPYQPPELLARVNTLVRIRHLARTVERAQQFEKQLIGIVSHDLRTPLTAILISASSLQRWTEDPRLHRGLDRMRRAAERAERMVRDLLDFTQARLGGGLTLRRSRLDLHVHAAAVLEELRLANPGRVLTLTTSAEVHGLWDGDRFAQLLTNLVSNALRYGDPATPVVVALGKEGEAITLSVHNRGPPIPADQLERIFEPMQRGPAAADRTGRSVGLGLYIVRAITSAHHGSIQVRSDAAEGTRFVVRLPREQRSQEQWPELWDA